MVAKFNSEDPQNMGMWSIIYNVSLCYNYTAWHYSLSSSLCFCHIFLTPFSYELFYLLWRKSRRKGGHYICKQTHARWRNHLDLGLTYRIFACIIIILSQIQSHRLLR